MIATRPRLVLLLLVVAAVGTHAEWKDCSTGPTVFKVSDVTLDPNPVKPGDLAKFVIQAESSKELRGGSVQMIVHYAGMPIWTQMDNLCDKADCPVKQGPTQVRYSQLFPGITPPGSYTVTLDGHAGAEQLFCVTVPFQVVPPQAADVAAGWEAALGEAARQQALTTHRKRLAA
ncbi:phosphatidylglycerol phosphatidylinositol transfer [Chlorella sorokiniana]|jgi:hypothetical protein|uniref:Phosphatidylglycerol phosphatidylinositol transfer n=1 Tax=Chlorella sorokiniana TaxID=3076 RepID=A0A2P6TP41_CHLSO|nr:phosphatidylglycerol phosphatidylinositol transfer [Chlorella sorokiniana]|eukprot:PRW51093.1 phosphatidylglycerol phosphatidylinositol transfer [Chlorella sorokiniana]